MQQGCQTQLSMSSPFSLNSSRFVFTCPPPPSLLCSCADQMADTLMGPVLSNGAGLEFDTLTPPISAACHQEPHRMLSGKCLYCLLEFLWWAWVSSYRETQSESSNRFEVAFTCWSEHHKSSFLKYFYYGNIFCNYPDTSFLGFPLLPWGSLLQQSGFLRSTLVLCCPGIRQFFMQYYKSGMWKGVMDSCVSLY